MEKKEGDTQQNWHATRSGQGYTDSLIEMSTEVVAVTVTVT